MKKTVGIIQARMQSTRLPGKSLVDVAGKPMLQHVIERFSRAGLLDDLVIATTDDPADTPILDLARRLGVPAIAGDRDDVLARFLMAAETTRADVLVRVTGDCPLIDPALSDAVIATRAKADADYAGNFAVRTFPRGADTEAFTIDSFRQVAVRAVKRYEREHVTPYYYRHPEEFRVKVLVAPPGLRRPHLRLCVDTVEDLELVRAIYSRLGPANTFSIPDAVARIHQEPALARINAQVRQKPATDS